MLTSKRTVSRYSLLRALASSNTICDSPRGAWALYMWFHLSILRRRFFSSRWNDEFFFRAVWGLGTFSLDPFVVSFSRRQPSNEDVFTANVLYLCNLSFKRCYNESPLRFVQFILNFIPIDVFSLPNHDCKSPCVCVGVAHPLKEYAIDTSRLVH